MYQFLRINAGNALSVMYFYIIIALAIISCHFPILPLDHAMLLTPQDAYESYSCWLSWYQLSKASSPADPKQRQAGYTSPSTDSGTCQLVCMAGVPINVQ